jgi:hypothetical protein
MKIDQKLYNYTMHEEQYIYICILHIIGDIYICTPFIYSHMHNYDICLYYEGGMVTIPSHGWFMALFFPHNIYVYMTYIERDNIIYLCYIFIYIMW